MKKKLYTFITTTDTFGRHDENSFKIGTDMFGRRCVIVTENTGNGIRMSFIPFTLIIQIDVEEIEL